MGEGGMIHKGYVVLSSIFYAGFQDNLGWDGMGL